MHRPRDKTIRPAKMLFFFIFLVALKGHHPTVLRLNNRFALNSGTFLSSLGKVRRHILLEVKVSELISGLKLQKSSKLLVRVNLAAIGGMLELLSAGCRC